MSQKKSAEKFVEPEFQALWELENFIASNPDPRKLKRAASIPMLIEGVCRETIQKILGVSSPFKCSHRMGVSAIGAATGDCPYKE